MMPNVTPDVPFLEILPPPSFTVSQRLEGISQIFVLD